MKNLIRGTIFLAMTLGAFAHAETVVANDFFRPLAAQIPDKIIKSCGIEKIGKLDLVRLRETAKSTEWRVFDQGFVSDRQGKGRTWAIYEEESQVVLVNQMTIKNQLSSPYLKATLPMLALHETLRAFGGADEDYQTSIALAIIGDTCDTTPFSHDLAVVKEGGVTSTGGGGDETGLMVKTILLLMILRNESYDYVSSKIPEIKNWDRQKLKKKILSLQIENEPIALGTIEPKATYIEKTNTYQVPMIMFFADSQTLIHQTVLDLLSQVVKNETR